MDTYALTMRPLHLLPSPCEQAAPTGDRRGRVSDKGGASMLFRIGQVVWWIGTLTLGLILSFGAYAVSTSDNPDRIEGLALFAGGGALWAACCWALAYVLTESFWKPPRGPGR